MVRTGFCPSTVSNLAHIIKQVIAICHGAPFNSRCLVYGDVALLGVASDKIQYTKVAKPSWQIATELILDRLSFALRNSRKGTKEEGLLYKSVFWIPQAQACTHFSPVVWPIQVAAEEAGAWRECLRRGWHHP